MLVFLLRHAERLPDPADDLTPDGVERAKLLAQMLADSGVHIAFCSKKIRTQRTIEAQAAVSVAPLRKASARSRGASRVLASVAPSASARGPITARTSRTSASTCLRSRPFGSAAAHGTDVIKTSPATTNPRDMEDPLNP